MSMLKHTRGEGGARPISGTADPKCQCSYYHTDARRRRRSIVSDARVVVLNSPPALLRRSSGSSCPPRRCARTPSPLHQGLALVHFSAQREPFLTLKLHDPTQSMTQKLLKSGRTVDEWTPHRAPVLAAKYAAVSPVESGPANIARHVIGCNFTQETGVQSALDDVASNGNIRKALDTGGRRQVNYGDVGYCPHGAGRAGLFRFCGTQVRQSLPRRPRRAPPPAAGACRCRCPRSIAWRILARHVLGCHLPHETRVQSALADRPGG